MALVNSLSPGMRIARVAHLSMNVKWTVVDEFPVVGKMAASKFEICIVVALELKCPVPDLLVWMILTFLLLALLVENNIFSQNSYVVSSGND